VKRRGCCKLAVSILLCARVLAGQQALKIGSGHQLFVDDYLIESMKGVSLKLHPPQPAGRAIAFDQPWEGNVSAYAKVFQDGDRYRLYYRGASDPAYVRPSALQPGEVVAPAHEQVACCAESRDGIHWTKLRQEPIITDGAFDSLNLVFWDARRELYVAIYRDFLQGVRMLKCATSKDFLAWTRGQWADYGNAPAEHLYTSAATPYSRAPHIYLGFPKRFVPWRKAYDDVPGAGLSDAVFMTSRDGVRWDRRFLEAFVRPGRDRRDWVHRTRMVAAGVAPTAPDEISLYVSRHYNFPSAHLERMTLRTDGFVSVYADYRGGEFVTRPLAIEGSSLVLNYATSAAGSIRFEILDPNGHPLPGYGREQTKLLCGDHIADVIPLQSAKRRPGQGLEARPVRLRFLMQDADLYSLAIRD